MNFQHKKVFSYNSFPRNSILVGQYYECTFSGANLDYCRAGGAKFSQCNFVGASLRHADLSGAIFTDCDFTAAFFLQAKLHHTVFNNCTFLTASTSGAIGLDKAVFLGGNDLPRGAVNQSKDEPREKKMMWWLESGWDGEDTQPGTYSAEETSSQLELLEPVDTLPPVSHYRSPPGGIPRKAAEALAHNRTTYIHEYSMFSTKMKYGYGDAAVLECSNIKVLINAAKI